MAISEQDPSLRAESGVEKQAIRYTHEDFVVQFGPNYREACERYFRESRALGEHESLKWLDPTDEGYTHPNSQANYLAWQRSGNNIIVVSAMPQGSSTSGDHAHPKQPPVVETYKVHKGKVELWLEGRDQILDESQRPFPIQPGQMHRLRTNGHWALVLIHIGNGAAHDPDKLHIRPEKK